MPLRRSLPLAMQVLCRQGQSKRKQFTSAAVKLACAAVCVLVLCSATAQAQPNITGFLVNGVAATGGPVGATLTIQGSGFGATQGFSTATLNGIAVAGNGVKPNSWSDTAIVVVVPTSATSGPVVVKVKGVASNGVNFTVAPVINSLSPSSGDKGTSVTITGANFVQGNTVTFNGVASTPSSSSSTKVVAPVPWTTSGKVVITVSGTQSNGVNFAIAAPVPAGTPGTGTFFVNRTDDPAVPVDSLGNPLLAQFCQNTSNTDTSSPCSLREAIVSVNGDAKDTSTSPDTIMLAGNTYHLTIQGTGTINATTGHLDITNAVTIVGAGAATIIQADSTLVDQVFLIDAPEEGSVGFPVTMSNLTIQGGQANQTHGLVSSGGAFEWEAGTLGNGQLTLTNVNIISNNATDSVNPGVADGGGMALINLAGVSTPAQVNITGSQIQNNQALDVGGGIFLSGAVSLTMKNSSVTGNHAVGGGRQLGGGLFLGLGNNPPSGATSSPSTIQNSNISQNVAGSSGLGEGGGVRTEQSLTINQGSVINANQAGGAGGGIATAVAGASDQVVISSSTITGNTSANGGGVEVDGNSKANLQLSFNRFFGNNGGANGSGLANQGTGTVSATDNWWGCNQGPQTSGNGCDTVSGTVTSSPWIVLSNTASPTSVLKGTSTTLTASVLQDSSNATLSASNLTPLIGLPVSYPGGPLNGTLSQQQPTIQPNGTATATFTTTGSPTASSQVQVDNAVVTANVNVQDFSISVTAVKVNIGLTTASLPVTVSAIGGFNGVVTLACGTLPSGMTCPSNAFNPPTVTGSGTSTLTVNIASSVAPGPLSIPVTGTSSSLSEGGSGTLTLADFSLSISPSSATIILNQTATYTVTCSTTTGFAGPVQLSSTLGGTSLSPNPVNCPGTSTLTVTPTVSGSPNVPVSGTFGTAVRGTSASLVVQDYSVSVSSVTENNGLPTASLTVTVTSINGFNSVVTLGCGTMPTGITCPSGGSFNPPTVTPPPNGQATSTLTVNLASSVPAGTYSIPATGTSSGVVRSGIGSLNLAAFSLSLSPTSASILLGQTASFTVTCSTNSGFSGPVQLSSALSASFSPNPMNCPGTSTMTLTPTAGGTFTVPVSGTFGTAPPQLASASLSVRDFQLSISNANQSVAVNGSVSYTVTATSIGGFSGTVSLACSGSLAGADISCGNIAIPAGGSGSTTFTVKTSGLTSPGNFTVSASGQSSGLNRSASAGLAVFDSRTWGIGGSITCCSGGVGTFTLNVNNSNETVNYCFPADLPVLACEELGAGQPAVNSPATVAQALAKAVNGDSSSPATASIVNGALTLTAKTVGTFLRITSVDNGMAANTLGSMVGGPSVYTLDTTNLAIGGAPDGGCCGGNFTSTYTVFVSVNGGPPNFSESVAYCNPLNTPIPGCEELSPPSGVYSADQIQQALVKAFNADSSSPVTAAITNNGLTLTAKTPGTLLIAGGVDDGIDTTTGVGFTASQVLNVPNSVGLVIQGGISPNCCGGPSGGSFSTFTMTVNANGTNFSKSQSYCPPGTLPLPACKLPNGQSVEDVGTILQSIVNQFNSDSSSPVTAAINFGIVVLTAKTPGTVLTAGVADDGGGMSSAEVGP